MTELSVDYVDFNIPDIWRTAKENEFESEARFVHDLIQKHSPKARTIIDIGCGSGDHNYFLEKHGYQTCGIDLNENMVKFAQSLFPDQHFEVGNMQSYRAEKPYDVAMCLCTTFCRNLENRDIDKTLKNFHNLLNKNGLLMLDMFNPISFLDEAGMPKEFDYNPEAYSKHNLNAVVSLEVNQVAQTIDCTRIVKEIGKDDVKAKEEYSFRLFFPQELKYFLEKNGFSFLSFYGDFDISKTNLFKNRLITIAQKI